MARNMTESQDFCGQNFQSAYAERVGQLLETASPTLTSQPNKEAGWLASNVIHPAVARNSLLA